jgi:hypothetical protein
MSEEPKAFDPVLQQKINDERLAKTFFTPDFIYVDLVLFKDFNLGAILYEGYLQGRGVFEEYTQVIKDKIEKYQTRRYDTVGNLFATIGFNDKRIESLLSDKSKHLSQFIFAPQTNFLIYFISHMARNKNHSAPAEKFEKVKIDEGKHIRNYDEVTVLINTWPLTLPENVIYAFGETLGSELSVNILMMNKDPSTFDEEDWTTWVRKVDCFYSNLIGPMLGSDMMQNHQAELDLCGKYMFVRKRFEREFALINQKLTEIEFERIIAEDSSKQSMLIDLEWIANRDLSFPEYQDIPDTIDPDVETTLRNNP